MDESCSGDQRRQHGARDPWQIQQNVFGGHAIHGVCPISVPGSGVPHGGGQRDAGQGSVAGKTRLLRACTGPDSWVISHLIDNRFSILQYAQDTIIFLEHLQTLFHKFTTLL